MKARLLILSIAIGLIVPIGAANGFPTAKRFQKYPPGIMYNTLLSNVGLVAKGAWLKLGNQMQNVFIDSGKRGKVVLSRANGDEFCHWEWSLNDYALPAPYKRFVFYDAKRPNNSAFNPNDLKLTETGDYVLDFFVDGKKFYTFAFSVSKLDPASPFDGETLYFLDGPWRDWGYLMYPDADPNQNLLWKIWLREKGFSRPDHKVMVQITRDADKKLVCQSRPEVTHNFSQEWVRYEIEMTWPAARDDYGSYFKARDLLAKDGAYTLKMTIDGKEYGTWKFSVAGGKLVPAGRTVRGTADPLTFVEGGKDAFWYERVK